MFICLYIYYKKLTCFVRHNSSGKKGGALTHAKITFIPLTKLESAIQFAAKYTVCEIRATTAFVATAAVKLRVRLSFGVADDVPDIF